MRMTRILSKSFPFGGAGSNPARVGSFFVVIFFFLEPFGSNPTSGKKKSSALGTIDQSIASSLTLTLIPHKVLSGERHLDRQSI